MAGMGQRATQDGCESVAAVSTQTGGSSDGIANLVAVGLIGAGAAESTSIRVPATLSDFSTSAQQLQNHDCAVLTMAPNVVAGVIAANASLGGDTQLYVIGGALTSHVVDPLGPAVEGDITYSNFPVGEDPIWDEAREHVTSITDDTNGGWSAP